MLCRVVLVWSASVASTTNGLRVAAVPAPPPPPSPCVDTARSCDEWASRGECESNKIYMKAHCPRRCGLCDSSNTASPKASTVAEPASSQHEAQNSVAVGVSHGNSPASHDAAQPESRGQPKQEAAVVEATAAAATPSAGSFAATTPPTDVVTGSPSATTHSKGDTAIPPKSEAAAEAVAGADIGTAELEAAEEAAKVGDLSTDLSDLASEMDAAALRGRNHLPQTAGGKMEHNTSRVLVMSPPLPPGQPQLMSAHLQPRQVQQIQQPPPPPPRRRSSGRSILTSSKRWKS